MTPSVPDPELARRHLAHPRPLEQALRAQWKQLNDPREAAWRLAETLGRQLQLEDCVVYFLEPDEAVLLQVAAWGPKQVAPRIFDNPIRLPVGRGIVGGCARDAVPVLVPDTRLDPRYVIDDAIRLSELAVPLLRRGELLGVIDSEHSQADAFRSEHIRVLLRFGELFTQSVTLQR